VDLFGYAWVAVAGFCKHGKEPSSSTTFLLPDRVLGSQARLCPMESCCIRTCVSKSALNIFYQIKNDYDPRRTVYSRFIKVMPAFGPETLHCFFLFLFHFFVHLVLLMLQDILKSCFCLTLFKVQSRATIEDLEVILDNFHGW
jgi:hypothetical protein